MLGKTDLSLPLFEYLGLCPMDTRSLNFWLKPGGREFSAKVVESSRQLESLGIFATRTIMREVGQNVARYVASVRAWQSLGRIGPNRKYHWLTRSR